MKKKENLLLMLSMLFFTVSGMAALDRFQANYVDGYYSWGWPREYSAYLYEYEAYDFMRENSAKQVFDHFGTTYITSDNLTYLYSEFTGNFKGSNEKTHFYSHDVYHSGFSQPEHSEENDPGYCSWEGWTPGQTDGGYTWGGSVYLYGEYNFMVNFVETYLKNSVGADIAHAWKNNCFVGKDNEHFAILMIPYVNVVKLHNMGK